MRTPRANDGAMSHTKSHRKLASEMREAQLKKERHEAPRRARLKVETTLAVAAFNVRVLTQSPLAFYPTIGDGLRAKSLRFHRLLLSDKVLR